MYSLSVKYLVSIFTSPTCKNSSCLAYGLICKSSDAGVAVLVAAITAAIWPTIVVSTSEQNEKRRKMANKRSILRRVLRWQKSTSAHTHTYTLKRAQFIVCGRFSLFTRTTSIHVTNCVPTNDVSSTWLRYALNWYTFGRCIEIDSDEQMKLFEWTCFFTSFSNREDWWNVRIYYQTSRRCFFPAIYESIEV